jgi:hypothetical protein
MSKKSSAGLGNPALIPWFTKGKSRFLERSGGKISRAGCPWWWTTCNIGFFYKFRIYSEYSEYIRLN